MGTRPLRLAAACVLLPALALAGCGTDGSTTGSSTPASSTAATASSAAATSTAASTVANTVARTGPLYENAAPFLNAAREEFGEIEVSVLYVYADEATLWYVNPSAPLRSTLSHRYRDGTWTDPTSVPHPTTGRTLSLNEIDPETIRAAAETAPGILGVEDAEVDHVAIGTGETDEQEYVVSMTSDNGVGSVIFSPDLRVLEALSFR